MLRLKMIRLERQHLRTRQLKMQLWKKSLQLRAPLKPKRPLRLKKLLPPRVRRWKNSLLSKQLLMKNLQPMVHLQRTILLLKKHPRKTPLLKSLS